MSIGIRLTMIALLAGGAAKAGCGDEVENPCDSTIRLTTLTSPSTGVVTIQGNFPSDETVLALYTIQGQQYQKTGIVGGNTLTFSGIPAGLLTIDFVVSCQGVELERPTLGVGDVQVK